MTTPKLEKEIHCKSIIMRTALMAFCIVAPMCLGAVSPASASKVVEVIRNFIRFEKIRKTGMVIDGTKALKNGEKVYRAADVAKEAVRVGKGMLGKMADSVADDVIKECTEYVGKKDGVIEIDKILKKAVNASMTAKERSLLLNDAWLRIARKAEKITTITAKDADDAFQLLKDTEQLHVLVRKCCYATTTRTGFQFEFRQALAFRKKGFDVIGVSINYSVKSGQSDLDLLVKKGKDLFLVESKHYTGAQIWEPKPKPNAVTILEKADGLLNLKEFLNSEFGGTFNVKPIFTFLKNPPADVRENLLKKGIPCLVGEADELAELLAVMY